MATGPDQGFAWVIALSCFLINFIMAGLARTAGILYVAIIGLYGISREAATTPFSVRVSVRNMTGPLIGFLGLKYGIRGVTAIGGFVAAVGSIMCYFAPNVFWMTMFWGVIHGLGFGMSTVLHMIAINQYFDKYKASAMGLGYSGDCFGTFVFPVIIEFLFTTYGVRGSFLIIGGLVLNVIPMALLLRKPPWIKTDKKHRKSQKKRSKNPSLKNHKNSLFLQRTEVLKSNSSAGFLSTVKENDGFEKGQEDDSNGDSNTNMFSTFGYDSNGQYNKAFESSETDLNAINDNKLQNLKNPSSGKFTESFENEKSSIGSSQNVCSTVSATKALQQSRVRSSNPNLRDSRYFGKTDSLPVPVEMRGSKSVTDLNNRNELCNARRMSLRLQKYRVMNSADRRESLKAVERNNSIREKTEDSNAENDEANSETERENEYPCAEEIVTKKRAPSFVEQVAHDFVNRVRTASFASQVAQDGFVATFGQDSDSESEQEAECELKCIVEHTDHDVENCTRQDRVLSVDQNMMKDYFKDISEEPRFEIEEKPKPPSTLKLFIQTNTKPMFVLISISMAVFAFLFVGVLTIIIDYASDLGINEDRAKYLIIGFSVADLIGRLSFGQVIDRKLMKMKNYSCVTTFLMGVLAAVIPLNTSFNYMMVCMCMYGVVQGGVAIMFPILINLYMDKSSESVAMGCCNFYGGILMLSLAPMIGYFRDNIGSYNYVFYIIGGSAAVVGIFWQFEPMIIKYQNKKLREKYIMKEIFIINPETNHCVESKVQQ